MKCPHCRVAFHEQAMYDRLGHDADGRWVLKTATCPACEKLIISLLGGRNLTVNPSQPDRVSGEVKTISLVRPKAALRPACPPEVPSDLAEDYNEACLVLPDSPKASAALSRRCLQHLLRDHAGVNPSNLATEIQQVLDSGSLPSHLENAIDAVRNIGNFAAHPVKSQSTGEALPVEPGEADWNLDTLEALFDYYFVQPAALKAKRDKLSAKLAEAGKPPPK